jgi:HEAT repeat protein
MTITMSDVRAQLDPEEPNYDRAAELGPEALPVLDELVHSDDPLLAAKAAYLASLIPGERRASVLAAAAMSPEPTVRVAAAAGLRNLAEVDAGGLADDLLQDADVGVRKQALQSVAGFASTAMAQRVRRVADTDSEEFLRGIAAESLGQE